MAHPFCLAVFSYLSFFVVQIYVVKVFQRPYPNTHLARRHIEWTVFCSGLFLYYVSIADQSLGLAFEHWFVFTFTLLGIHIPWVSNLIELSTRSVSVNYLMDLVKSNGQIRVNELNRKYSRAGSFGNVTEDRIECMLHYKILRRVRNSKLEVDKLGYALDFCRRHFLRLWKLRQLGQ
jgi:hypothetical protein